MENRVTENIPHLAQDIIEKQNLNFDRISEHTRRVYQSLKSNKNTFLPILHPCTTENGSVLSWELVTEKLAAFSPLPLSEWRESHCVSFIPAAGAASRFLSDLHKFILEIESKIPFLGEINVAFTGSLPYFLTLEKKQELLHALKHFKAEERYLSFWKATRAHLFPTIKENSQNFFDFIINTLQNIDEKIPLSKMPIKEENTSELSLTKQDIPILQAFCCAVIITQQFNSLPKALVPATAEGDSFLKLKIDEQKELFPCLGNILVVPAQQKNSFRHFLNEKWDILEQSTDLCTIRFSRNGTPLVNSEGYYSIVSAGHGELIHLFDNVLEKYPSAKCLHIRNIDNIIGTTKERYSDLAIPTEFFRITQEFMEILREKIRNFLQVNKEQTPETIEDKDISSILSFLTQFLNTPFTQSNSTAFQEIHADTLYSILGTLFFWGERPKQKTIKETWIKIGELLERPLSVLGVVRKEEGDIGGGPVFAKTSEGDIVKICLEMPHATPEDSHAYFGPKGLALYFNPVLVFFEIASQAQKKAGERFSHLFDDRFWLLAKRDHLGVPVCYHETVLYELIGNSSTTNLVFIEVPRTLFCPHKTYFDVLGNTRKSYGFIETATGQK